MADDELSKILATTVYVDGENRPFGELTLEQVRGRADELRAATGWGPTARVAPVARAWRVATVGELDPETIAELAPKTWVVPPGGSLLP
jgi:hypothetical protein